MNLILYTRPGCPFCARVLKFLVEKNIPFEEKSSSDPVNVEETIRLGGKRQFPFLVDTQAGVSMYESIAIIEYLEKTYTKNV